MRLELVGSHEEREITTVTNPMFPLHLMLVEEEAKAGVREDQSLMEEKELKEEQRILLNQIFLCQGNLLILTMLKLETMN